MTQLRVAGAVVAFLLLSLWLAYDRLEEFSAVPDNGSSVEDEDRDDPVVDVLCLKALGYVSNDQYEKAIEAFTEAIRREPKYAFAYLGRANAYMAKGDTNRALADFDQAARLDPNDDTAKTLADEIRREQ